MSDAALTCAFLAIADLFKGPRQSLRVEVEGYMPLTVERIGTGPSGRFAFSFCHYGEQNGDLMRDPEVCFEIHEQGRHRAAVAYYYRNDYAGYEAEGCIWFTPDGCMRIDAKAADAIDFARTWSRNLHEQGFVAAAAQAAAASAESIAG